MSKPQSNGRPINAHSRSIVLFIILTGALTSLAVYWFILGMLPSITPTQAKKFLGEENPQAILIDIRKSADFASAHIDGAVNWPLEEILKLYSAQQIPRRFQDKMLLFICNGGFRSSEAVRHLMRLGIKNVKNVRGGIQEWIASVSSQEGGAFERFSSESGTKTQFPFRQSPLYQQLAAVISGFVIKPAYTLLSLIVAIVLRKSRSADLAALRWSMICFFIGENFCAANYYFFTDKSYLFEFFHSYGMLLAFGFATYAVVEGIDSRILMLSQPDRRCAAQGLCVNCIKYEGVSCGLRRTFLVIIPAMAIVAILPLFAAQHNVSYNTMIFGTFYNYSRRLIYQHFEMQFCPLAAMVMLIISLGILLFKKENALPTAKIFFAAGAGPLGFSLMRSTLTALYSDNIVWFAFWEETTELMFIVGVCFILLVFRKSLFRVGSQ